MCDALKIPVSIFGESDADALQAGAIASRYGLNQNDETCVIRLMVSASGLSLHVMQGELRGGKPIVCDWAKRDVASSMGERLTQPIYKAIGLHKGDPYRPHVIDATAGLGEDAYLLACAGCHVTAIERCAVLAAMLEDAARRFKIDIDVIHDNSMTALTKQQAEVVYLDPMFPAGRRTVERKALRVLRDMVGDDDDAEQLLTVALQTATRRVVVKRPLRAALLGNTKPKVSHKGQAVRYDVYIPGEMASR